MDAVLLDTDVFSFFFKGDSRAARYAPDIRDRQLCLCFQTVAELRMWAIWRGWNTKRQEKLADALHNYVVLPYDTATTDCWAKITAHRRRIGREIACGDAWIAAAALWHGVPLLTHNAADYADIPGLGREVRLQSEHRLSLKQVSPGTYEIDMKKGDDVLLY